MKAIFGVIVLTSLLVFSYAQQKLPFRGYFIVDDKNCNYIVTYDTLTNDSIGFQRIYRDTLNRVDNKGRRQGLWMEFYRTSYVYYGHHWPPKDDELVKTISPEDFVITFFGIYKNDKKEGVWKAYHANGTLWKEAFYKNGRITGNFKYLYDTGKPQMLGKQISETLYEVSKFDEQGNLINSREYHISKLTFLSP